MVMSQRPGGGALFRRPEWPAGGLPGARRGLGGCVDSQGLNNVSEPCCNCVIKSGEAPIVSEGRVNPEFKKPAYHLLLPSADCDVKETEAQMIDAGDSSLPCEQKLECLAIAVRDHCCESGLTQLSLLTHVGSI